MKNKKNRLFTTDSVDDDMFMCADLHINKTFKDGLEFEFEKQTGSTVYFTLYKDGVEQLSEFLNEWIKKEEH